MKSQKNIKQTVLSAKRSIKLLSLYWLGHKMKQITNIRHKRRDITINHRDSKGTLSDIINNLYKEIFYNLAKMTNILKDTKY